MFARVTQSAGLPERIDELVAEVEKIVPVLSPLEGFRGIVLLANRETGAGLAVTYWETEAAMTASEAYATQARGSVQSNVAGFSTRDIDRFEIVVQERVAPPTSGLFVRVNDYVADTSKLDAMASFTLDNVLPVLKTQKGFRSAHMLVNRQSGRTLAVTAWDSAAERDAGYASRAPLREQLREVAGAGPATADLFEAVLVDVRLTTPA
jgi:heme-degrading monooxygenase HmoA